MAVSPQVSVIIPVYRYSEGLRDLVSTILSDPYDNKEVIVVVDEPSEEFYRIPEIRRCQVIVHEKRRGKVSSLNEAVERSHGEWLIFLDADVIIGKNFVSRAVSYAESVNAELIDFIKLGTTGSLIERLATFDYAVANLIFEASSRFLKRTAFLDGAAFMIKRETLKRLGGFDQVFSEDLELGIKSYSSGVRYSMSHITVYVRQPSDIKRWAEQRFRWAYGMAEWSFRNFFRLILYVLINPIIIISALALIVPPVTSLGLFYLTSAPIINNVMMLYMINPLIKFYPILLRLPRRDLLFYLRAASVLGGSFAASIATYASILRHYKVKYRAYDLLLYYFVYQPMLLLVYLLGFAVYLMRINVELNWKVEKG
jgi:cellulose synthase/poly-beta-1,6-N-acetylglucosamine synthase-like glycosyltransferase